MLDVHSMEVQEWDRRFAQVKRWHGNGRITDRQFAYMLDLLQENLERLSKEGE